jgi:hypothetical protein
MQITDMRKIGLRIIAFAAAALFSTMALALPIIWEFTGASTDQTPFSATMTFEAIQQPSQTISSTITIPGTITATTPVLTEYFSFTDLSFELGYGSALIEQGSTGDGSIIQTDLLGTGAGFTDTYLFEAIFTSAQYFTQTLTIDISGSDLFNSLLTDVNTLQSNLPGTFLGFGYEGVITGVSDVTAIPEPWTLGLMLSGLASIGFLSLARRYYRP